MENIKHTKEYAEHLAKFHLVNISDDWSESSFTAGYMRAIEETAAPEMLDVLIKLKSLFDGRKNEMERLINEVISKATK